jgi:hypothetical protein
LTPDEAFEFFKTKLPEEESEKELSAESILFVNKLAEEAREWKYKRNYNHDRI